MIGLIALTILSQTAAVRRSDPALNEQGLVVRVVNDGGFPVSCTNCSGGPGGSANQLVYMDGGQKIIVWDGTDTALVSAAGAVLVDGSATTQPVSGTLTCNAGSNLNTSALALDATLTGGTQKAITRGGAKGATSAADVTSTANGADHQGLDVQVQNATLACTQSGGWTVTTTPPSNASTNVAQFGGTNVSTGTGAGGAGIPRVTISNDSSLAANQSVNVAQMNGVAVSMGVGASGTGTQRNACLVHDGTDTMLVTTAGSGQSDIFSISGTAVSTAAAGVMKVGIVGNANAAIDASNNAAAPANVIANGAEAAAMTTTQPTAATAGNMRRIVAGTDGVLYMRQGGPVQWSCFVQGVTATTQCRAAPAVGLRAYVTGVACSNQAATAQTLDIVFGTGSNCATGTTALTHKWQMGTVATTTSPFVFDSEFTTPLVPTAANAICVRPSAATAFGCTLTGYDAP